MIVIPVLVSLVAVCVVSFFLYLKWTFSYWSKRNVFTLPPVLPFGNANKQFYRKATFTEEITEVYKVAKKKGLSYCGYHFFFQPTFVPVDVDLVRKMLTVDFQYFTDRTIYVDEDVDPLSGHLFSLKGAKWKALRTKLSPLFSSGKLKMMFQTLVDCSKNLPAVLEEAIASDSPIDIKDTFARYTTDVIGSVGFGIECNCLKNPDNEFREYGKKSVEVKGFDAIKFLFALLSPKILQITRTPNTRKDVENFFLGLTKDTIEYRDRTNFERQDFIQLLMKLRNKEIKVESATNNNSKSDGIAYYQNGLTMNEIAAQAFVFFVAGFETSSTTLNFMMYELATHPEIQDKLREEINQVLAKHDGNITYEAIQEMTYLDMCTFETLRKYPPLPSQQRECTRTYKVPDSDLTIEKGTAVLIPIYAIHHDPEIYPDPEKYDPERFSDEVKKKRSPFAFLAFGEGPRICIGMRLGLLQTKVGLVTMLKDYKFTLNPKTQLPIKFEPFQFVITAQGGIWVEPHTV
ncbi:probable cytochrome P450 6a13 [Agrilus planipennis]|uniref:Probable cytochrome P450 6a13 n=1 Tax=Agrilus planipennis TaxID=224129 RepID=A0A1W4WFN3_AGRPL|nr:probable cytochrome P450 6a13 [Agrilus planipennis]